MKSPLCWDVQIAAVKRAGIQYIEARGLDHISVSDLTVAQALEMKKRLDEGGIKLSSLGSPLGKVDVTLDFVPHYNKFLHTLELAQIFECPYIRMFSFYYPKGHRPEEYRNLVMERWFRFVEAAKDLPVTLLHENELDIYGDNAARCLDILSTIRSPKLRAVFDPPTLCSAPRRYIRRPLTCWRTTSNTSISRMRSIRRIRWCPPGLEKAG